MTVELISVGTELLMGNIVNTNAQYLSRKCAELGFSLYFQITVGDNEGRLCEVIETALHRSDIIILTGGLGPTQDDITKESVAKVLKRNLVMDEESKRLIDDYFKFRFQGEKNTIVTENNWKQALKIEDSIVIKNDNGTAPGSIVEINNKSIIILPGPPAEMKPMFEQHIFPYLKKKQNKTFVSKMIKICGIGESRAETDILDLIEKQSNPTIAPYAKNGEVHFRITAAADCEAEAHQLLSPVVNELYQRFGENIYTSIEEETLEEVVAHLLIDKKYTLTTAESCTGGMLTGRIVNIPGVSDILKEGFITYSNEAKMKYLGVKKETLDQYGAVSSQTAQEMALGAAEAAEADAALAITGIAGPDGGTKDKPVGLVYIACNVKGHVTVKECHFKGNRQKVRDQSVIYALDLLRRSLK
ncbi:competence/damage-inducible protein A [Lachnospiraceae bacterium MD1]|uniref:Putative competence-damage inducible protein n=1 Tax=Variimorphobacter saccharofermentans TaxID=2755051 RepID=A0A839JZC7_9FIRM|nr:competence/damage-inducible protein A [Variimorphobacter saccharofermentans]MBB2183033.1 competence/damage-inducible protein A [Variimorphobacter saccharofermentans]